MGAIKERIKAYKKLSDEIETEFRDAYEAFIFGFIKNIRDGLNEALNEAIKKADRSIKKEEKIEEKEEHYRERVPQKGFFGLIKRFCGRLFSESWGYDEVSRTRNVMTIKAGAVVDYLIEMHEICEGTLNDSVKSFKSVFKKELYEKILSKLCEIIQDNGLIDKYAFKKSVHAVTDKIEFKEFDHTDIPSEIEGQTGFLKGDEVKQFIESVKSYVRGFEDKTLRDVKEYCTYLEKELENQNFADSYSKLVEKTQNLKNQVQNKAQFIAQLDAQIKALGEI